MIKYSKVNGKPHKNKRQLAERIDEKLRAAGLHAGQEEFDPVELMATIGVEAFDEGDKALAIVALKEVAQYVRPKLAPMQAPDERDIGMEAEEKKSRILNLLSNMGVPVNFDESADPQEVKVLVERDGLTPEEASAIIANRSDTVHPPLIEHEKP